MKIINSDKYTINQIAEYIEGFATGPFGGQHTSNRATIYNALMCIDDFGEGIEAWAERKKEYQAKGSTQSHSNRNDWKYERWLEEADIAAAEYGADRDHTGSELEGWKEQWIRKNKKAVAQDLDLCEMQIVKISGEDAVKLAKANNLPYKHPIFTISVEENKIYLCYDAWLDYDIDGYTHEQEWLLWPNDKSVGFTTPDIIKDFSELQASVGSLSKSNAMFVNEILALKAQIAELKKPPHSNVNPNPTNG